MGSENVMEVEVLKKEVWEAIDNRMRRSEFKIDALLSREVKEGDWDFNNEDVDRYRRRMLPFYLLEKETNAYPVYVDNSDLKMSKSKKVKNFKLCKITVF